MSKNKAKKVFATSAAAVMAATAVTPAVTFAAEKTFPDVPGGIWYEDAVNFLLNNGIVKGDENGNFNPDKELTRAEGAEFLRNALGLSSSGSENYPDVDSDDWFYDAVVATTAAGIFEGNEKGEFMPGEELDRQQAAAALVRAFGLEGSANLSFVDTDEIADWAKADVEAAYANGIIEGKPGNKFAPNDTISRAEFAVMVKRAIDATAAPEVVSVSAINAKQVVVKFNSPMNASTLIDASNLVQNVVFNETTSSSDAVDSSTATASLSADGKELTITLGGSDTFEGTYSITVDSDAKTIDGRSIKDYSSTFSITDRTAPEVVGVQAVTNTNVATSATVTFSEPVSAAVVKIDGVAYTPALGLGTTTLTFNGLALDATKSHTLEVLNATDAKTNIKPLQTTNFSVVKDTVAPSVQVTASGDHQLLLTFTKDMNVSTVTTSSVKLVEEDFTALTGTTEYTVTQVGNSKKQFLVNISKPLYSSKNERTLTVQINNSVKDELGNAGSVTTQNVKLVKDTTAPALQSTEVVKDANGNAAKLRLTFNETLLAAPTDLSKLSAKDAVTGVDAVVTDILDETTLTLLSDNKTVEVAVKPDALGNKYNFIGAAGFVQDTAQTANNSSGFAQSVEFSKASGAFTISQSSLNITTPNIIIIDFGQPVIGDFGLNAANNPANYTVSGKPLPVGTDIKIASDRQNVTITLPDEFVNSTDSSALFTVNNVKALAGATITPFVGYVEVKDNVTPKLQKVIMNADGSLSLDFDENVTFTTGSEAGVQIQLNNGSFTLPDTIYTFAPGTGADAGNIVVEFTTSDDPTYGTYIELGADTDYDAGTDVLVADIVNVSVKTLSPNTIVDGAGNSAKANITVSASK